VNTGCAVVELFTSQGDINSPPADQVLSSLITDAATNNKPVYCIAHHVDFWNRFGWKDPFSSLRSTKRLQNYSSALQQKETYTPIMIMNGRTILPPTDKMKINETIAAELKKTSVYLPEFSWEIFDDTLDVTYKVNPTLPGRKITGNEYLVVAIVENGLTTKVTKGDNAGKTLQNDGVVRLWYAVDLKSADGVLHIPLKSQIPGSEKSLLLFIQDKSDRMVLGAAKADFLK
jgi:hypothetical protein